MCSIRLDSRRFHISLLIQCNRMYCNRFMIYFLYIYTHIYINTVATIKRMVMMVMVVFYGWRFRVGVDVIEVSETGNAARSSSPRIIYWLLDGSS